MENNPNKNNGLITKIWGPSLWTSLHSITFGYPIEPSNEHKENYKNFYTLIGDVLPCKYCRESYKKFISTGKTKLTDDVLKNRETLTRWFYNIHDSVNKKLGVDYCVSYKDVVARYESYRAKCGKTIQKGCLTPLDLKAKSYKMAELCECQVIPINLAKEFIKYAKIRGLEDKYFEIIKKYNDKTLAKKMNDKCDEEWCERNKKCKNMITNMRKKGIQYLETEGKWIGLPTIDELKLIMNLCTNLEKETLVNILPKLPGKRINKKIFRFIKD
jgi:hypothetical protein